MWGNTAEAWGTGTKTLHWLLVLMIAVEVPVGFLMTATYAPSLKHADIKPLHDLLSQIHHTNGFAILGLGVLRLVWRANHPTPELPAGLALFQRWLARITQGFLLALLLVVPLSGWAALSVLADSEQFGRTVIWFFGSDAMPRLPFIVPKPFNDPTGYRVFGGMHRNLIYIGAALLGLHVLGALWHHLVRKDTVLLAMWPGTGARPGQR
jgi:cytochrome b561